MREFYRFEEFLLDARTGELTRSGTRIPIRGQSLELLVALLDRSGDGVAWSVRGHDRHGDPWSASCDAVVLVTQQASDDGLYRELAGDPAALAAAGIGAVHRIGDAVAPRLLSEAVFDGHRLAREIDSPDPATPLPFRRELADLG